MTNFPEKVLDTANTFIKSLGTSSGILILVLAIVLVNAVLEFYSRDRTQDSIVAYMTTVEANRTKSVERQFNVVATILREIQAIRSKQCP